MSIETPNRDEIAARVAAALVEKGIPATVLGREINVNRERVAAVGSEFSGSGYYMKATGRACIEITRVYGKSGTIAAQRSIGVVDDKSIEKAVTIIVERCAIRERENARKKAEGAAMQSDADMADMLRNDAPAGVDVEVRGGVVRLTVSPLTPDRARAMLAALAVVAS